MAKSLGQIHTVNKEYSILGNAAGDSHLLDLAQELSEQLQTMVRQGNYFKIVGIDMQVEGGDPVGGGTIVGALRYYAPTRGRCEAYKKAFRAVMKGMELQGINLRGNRNYDFRVPLRKTADFENPLYMKNLATIDGTNALCLSGATSTSDDIFATYNANIQPRQTAAVDFSTGFGLPGAAGTTTDFVLNEGATFDPSMERVAATDYEEIPFTLNYDPTDGTTQTTSAVLNWRPDPALYLAVMTGMFDIYIEDIYLDDGQTFLELDIAVHVAGWKSIMGNPDKKRRSSSKKTRGRKK